mmetsp:Transcript_73892/g.130548  ORF Transcript_73892/g.130548 Transcript_73892/m.130548 type:complete len:156 (+) Transcript_73892:324-791(+)
MSSSPFSPANANIPCPLRRLRSSFMVLLTVTFSLRAWDPDVNDCNLSLTIAQCCRKKLAASNACNGFTIASRASLVASSSRCSADAASKQLRSCLAMPHTWKQVAPVQAWKDTASLQEAWNFSSHSLVETAHLQLLQDRWARRNRPAACPWQPWE